LSQYQSVNSAADTTAQKPFQDYSGSFVAGVNPEQTSGITGTNTAANEAQPYYGAATGVLGSAQSGVNPVNQQALEQTGASSSPLTGSQIDSYLSPYLGTVLNSTEQIQNQENQQAQAGQLGTAISSGAFGGDRTGIAAANLQQQEDLANSNVVAGIANTGYQSALGTAQGQQQIGLAGAAQKAQIGQTAYGEGANTASELAGLGAGAQTAGLQGASAEIGAGTVQQQTQQAQDTALYNQFEQQQSYPFQVDQFLANIAEGTGALSGSTTTTTQPGGFFSDEHLKTNKRVIGKTFDGQPIYAYEMHGDPRTRIGLLAQQVERKHPGAVGVSQGYKTVDYGKATAKAANEGHFHTGGVVPMRQRRAAGGPSIVDSGDLQAILAAQQQMYAPFSAGGPYGSAGGPHGGVARVPAAGVPVSHLVTASASGLRQQPTGAQNVESAGKLYGLGRGVYKDATAPSQPTQPPGAQTYVGSPGTPSVDSVGTPTVQTDPNTVSGLQSTTEVPPPTADMGSMDDGSEYAARGGRMGFDGGGMPYSQDDGSLDIPDEDSHNTLSKPGALPPPSPSGFQQLMSMGSGSGGMGGMGGMLSGIGPSSSGSGATSLSSADYSGGFSDTGDAVDVISEAGARGGFFRKRAPGGVAPVRLERDFGGGADADSDDPSGNLGDSPDASVAQATALKQGAPNTSLDSVKNLALAAGEAYLGDYGGAADSVYNAYTDTQANNHRRGGRAGFDVGGTPADADPDVLPDTVVTADAIPADPEGPPTGLATAAPVPPQASGVAPAQAPVASSGVAPSKSLWDKIKDSPLAESKNLVPLLTAIGAMGTAPTRHFGVALAAGLGAGAQQYVPTQEGLASASLTQQQAQGAGIANQIAAMRAKAASDYLNPQPSSTSAPSYTPTQPQPSSAPAAPGQPPTSAQTAATNLDQQYRQKYFVQPGYTPDEQAQMQRAIKASMVLGPTPVDAVKQAHDNRVQTQMTTNQNSAQAEADQLYSQATDSTATPAAQAAALTKYNALHQWTGDKYENNAGARINSRTGAPAIGVAAQSLTPAQQQDAYQKALAQANDPITVGAGLPQMRWQAAKAASPEAYAASQVPGGYRISQSGPPTSGARPAAPVQPAGPGAPGAQSRAPQPQMLPGVDIGGIPKLAAPPAPTDQVSLGNAMKTNDANREIQNQALTGLRDQVTASARNNAIYTQLQAKLDAANPREFGPSSAAFKAVAGLKAYLTGIPPDGLVNQAEVDKYLSQLGVGGSKQLLGEGQQLRQQEMLLLMAHANPNIDQPLQVIKNLTAYGKAGNDYDLRAGNTGIAAIRGGADPIQVPGAIESQLHRSDYISNALGVSLAPPTRPGQASSGVVPTATGPNGQKLYLRNGAWVGS
jgi:hypothetical protein